MGRTGTFRRREAQLTSVALLSQPQIFRIGHVLLPASMALVPQGKVGRPCQNRLNSRVEVPQSQSPGRWHCPAFLGVNGAVTSGCQNTISTADPPHQAPCSHHPPPTASQSPSSLFCHPVPLSHPMPCCHLLSPVSSLPGSSSPHCQHLPVPISQGFLLSLLIISSFVPGPSPQSQQETHRHSQEVGVPFSCDILPCPPSVYLL